MNVTELGHRDAQVFLLKEESYCNIDLPPYFSFTKLLDVLHRELQGKTLNSYYAVDKNGKCLHPNDCEGVNYKLLSNKSGQYAWRPLQIIHPALYVEFVHVLTEEVNWNTICEYLSQKNDDRVHCAGLPIQSGKEKTSDKEAQVNSWWHEVVQKSIELSLDYEYLYHTDIVNCYGSVYTHSIPRALHGIDVAKNDRDNTSLVGNKIDWLLQNMSYGQTNGIPQGSVLMDLIAEVVLKYADRLLSRRIVNLSDFQIIRYRDDYRIFVNNPQDAETILKHLTEVLADLGMGLNEGKTVKSNNVVVNALKPDKFYWITTRNLKEHSTLQEYLYVLTNLVDNHPNAGSIEKPLQDIYDRLKKEKKILEKESIPVLISLITNIAYKNPRTYPVAIAIISRLIASLNDTEKLKFILKIKKRLDQLPYTGCIQLWLQRLTLKINPEFVYEEKLCRRVRSPSVILWCNDWLQGNLQQVIESAKIIDQKVIDEMDPIIEKKEFELFPHPSSA